MPSETLGCLHLASSLWPMALDSPCAYELIWSLFSDCNFTYLLVPGRPRQSNKKLKGRSGWVFLVFFVFLIYLVSVDSQPQRRDFQMITLVNT